MALSLTQRLAQIFRDYVTDGVPPSGAWDPRKDEIRTWGTELEDAVDALDTLLGGVDSIINVSGVAERVIAPDEINSAVIVDTGESPAQGIITIELPDLDDLDADTTGKLFVTKLKHDTNHPGKVLVTPPVIVEATGDITASSVTLALDDATGVEAGQLVLAIGSGGTWHPASGIRNETYVVSVAGNDVTLSLASTNAITGGTFHFYKDTIGGGGPRAFEIPGQSLIVAPDKENGDWSLISLILSTQGVIINGRHTIIGGTYNEASPYEIDPSTANGQMIEATPESNSATDDTRIDLPHPSLLASGYSEGFMMFRRSDIKVNYDVNLYTPNATCDQADTNTYPNNIEDLGDTEAVRTDGSEFSTLWRYNAHESGVCDVCVSYQNTPPDSISCPSAASTLYVVPKDYSSGDRVTLPKSTQTSNRVWRWHRVKSVISRTVSDNTYGYALSANATHNGYLWQAPGKAGIKLIFGQANAGTAELTRLDNARVNSGTLPNGVLAQSARHVCVVITNGSGDVTAIYGVDAIQANYFGTGYPGSGQSAARVGINTAPPTAGNPTLRVYAAYPDAFATVELYGGGGIAQSHISADTTQLLIKTIGSFPINIGTNNTIRWTFDASTGGFYSANATGGSKGADSINAKGIFIDGKSVSHTLSSQTGGNTNDSASGSGSYFDHTPTVTIPANTITQYSMLRVTTIWRMTSGSVPPTQLGFRLKIGTTSIMEFLGSQPATNLTNVEFTENFIIYGEAAPGASANVSCATLGSVNSYGATTVFNQIAQPNAFATNGSLTLTVGSRWNTAGTGTNTVELRAVLVEVINK